MLYRQAPFTCRQAYELKSLGQLGELCENVVHGLGGGLDGVLAGLGGSREACLAVRRLVDDLESVVVDLGLATQGMGDVPVVGR